MVFLDDILDILIHLLNSSIHCLEISLICLSHSICFSLRCRLFVLRLVFQSLCQELLLIQLFTEGFYLLNHALLVDGFLVLLLLELSLKLGNELVTITQLGLQVGDFTSGVVLCSAEQVG